MLERVKNYANGLPMRSDSEILKLIDNYDYISFDIFDTLIKRECGAPYTLFLILAVEFNKFFGQTIDKFKFVEIRREAERTAREKAKQIEKKEVLIEDIYNCFPYKFSDNELSWLKEREIELELSLCHPNQWVIRYYHYCLQKGKTVNIISDMYLSEEVIHEILLKNGIDSFQNLYLSSKYDLQKSDGSLFKIYLADLGVAADKCLHIGDSIPSDIISANKIGIKTIRIPKDYNTLRFSRNRYGTINVEHLSLLSKIQKSNISPNWDDYYCFGFECLGPMVFGICRWIHDTMKKENQKKIYFLSRDGFLVKQVFDMVYPGEFETYYLYVSRRSLLLPLHCFYSPVETIRSVFSDTVLWTYKGIAEWIGVSLETSRSAWINSGIDEEEYILNSNLLTDKRMRHYFDLLNEEILNTSKKEYESVIEYFKQQNFNGSEVAIFDVGWQGTCQSCIEKLLRISNNETKIRGYYVGLLKDSSVTRNAETFYPIGYLPHLAIPMALELCFTSNEGQVRSYKKNESGTVVPELFDCEYDDGKSLEIVLSIFAGALKFAETMKKCRGTDIINLSNFEYGIKLLTSFRYPRKKEIDMFGDITFYDRSISKLVETKPRFYYIKNPSVFFHDFFESGWKTAFIRKLVGVQVPFFLFQLAFYIVESNNKTVN